MKRAFGGLLLLTAACSGGGSGSGGSSGPVIVIANDGGSAEIVAGSAGRLSARFVQGSTAGPVTYRLADDVCEPAPSSPGPSTSSPVNAGTMVTWTATSTTVDAPQTGAGTYGAVGLSIPADTDWTITNAGGVDLAAQTLGTIRTPKTLIVNASTLPPVVAGEPLMLDFTPDTGATFVEIRLVGNSKDYRCNVLDDGLFTVPAFVTTAVGDGAQYSIIPTILTKVTVDGRDFLLRASSP